MTVYARPRTVADAARRMAEGGWQIFAGTTDVYPATVGRPVDQPALDITGIDGLRGIDRSGEQWRIGACSTWTDIASADLPSQFHGLQHAATQIGGPQVQNRATIGGNLCTASPAGDGIPALLSLSAQVELVSTRGSRLLPISEFITGYRQTALAFDEFVSHISIPARSGPSDFQKLGSRSHLVISIAMVATQVEVTDQGIIPRIAVGACSPVAVRLRGLEARLLENFDPLEVEGYAYGELSPIDDVRGSAGYRADVVGPLVRRSLEACRERL